MSQAQLCQKSTGGWPTPWDIHRMSGVALGVAAHAGAHRFSAFKRSTTLPHATLTPCRSVRRLHTFSLSARKRLSTPLTPPDSG